MENSIFQPYFNHISYIGNNGEPVMHSKSANIEIMIREHLK